MTKIFQRLVKGGRRASFSGDPRLTVGVFGKHPGWDDHIPGIGLETDVLAQLKQNFYVGGIGGQIDAGSWEHLEPEKRLDGFDHTFLWWHEFDIVLGQIWSSVDRKGRAKYPMIGCVHSQGLAAETLLGLPQMVLTQLRAGCRAAPTAEDVSKECQGAQQQLNAWLGRSGQETPQLAPAPEDKSRFLECPALGPDRLGLARILHELDNALGRSQRRGQAGAASDLRPYHVRVPLCADSQDRALLLWAEFLSVVLPSSAPSLLIARRGTDWLDIVVGSGSGEDVFCLQASPKALPLATEVPYELSPELLQRVQRVEKDFLGANAPTPAPPPPEAAPSPRPVEVKSVPAPTRTARTPGRPAATVVWAGAALLALAAGVWIAPKLLVSPARNAATDQPQQDSARNAATGQPQPDPARQAYAQAIAQAQNQLQQGNFEAAEQQARLALAQKPTDPAASNLLTQAGQARLAAAAKVSENKARQELASLKLAALEALKKHDWAAATNAWGQVALRAAHLKDNKQRDAAGQELQFAQAMGTGEALLQQGNFDAAEQQARLALGQRAKDPAASDLLARANAARQVVALRASEAKARQELDTFKLAAQDAVTKRDWAAATNAWGQAALRAAQVKDEKQRDEAGKELQYAQAMGIAEKHLQQGNFDAIEQQVKLALGQKPNDPAASALLAQAGNARQAAAVKAGEDKSRKEFETFKVAAQAAVTKRDWASATNAWAQAAQRAAQLKDEKHRDEAGKELQYAQAMGIAEKHLQQGNFDAVEQQVKLALGQKPNDPAAAALLAQAGSARQAAAAKAGEDNSRKELETFKLAAQAAVTKRDWASATNAWTQAAQRAAQLKDEKQREEAGKELQYAQAMGIAEKQLQQGNFDAVEQQAKLALSQKPNDPAASALLAQAGTARQAATAKAGEEKSRKDLEAFKVAAQAAVTKRDWAAATNAWAQAAQRAAQLKDEKQREEAGKELQYAQAMGTAEKQLQQGNFDAVEQQVKLALGQKPNDPAASALLAQAGTARQAAAAKVGEEKSRKEFETFKVAAQAAVTKRDWAAATNAWAQAAQRAAQLKDEKQREEAGKELQYAQAMGIAEKHLQQGNFDAVEQQVKLALGQKPNDPAASALLAQAGTARQAAAAKIGEEKSRKEFETFKVAAQAAVTKRDWAAATNAWAQAAQRAAQLKDEKQREEAGKELQYAQAMGIAEKQLQQGNFDAVEQQVKLALTQKPNDPAASALLAQAGTARQAAAAKVGEEKSRKEFETLKVAAQAAVTKRDWAAATNAWAQTAQRAAQLKDEKQREEAGKELQYAQAMGIAEKQLQQGNYDAVEQQVKLALIQKPNDPAASALLAQAGTARQAAAAKVREDKAREDQAREERAREEKARQELAKSRPTADTPAPKPPETKSSETARAATSEAENTGSHGVDYDNVLAVLEVRFKLRDADPAIMEKPGKQAQPLPAGALSGAQRSEINGKLRYLEDEFRKRGVLNDRKPRLKQISEAARTWK